MIEQVVHAGLDPVLERAGASQREKCEHPIYRGVQFAPIKVVTAKNGNNGSSFYERDNIASDVAGPGTRLSLSG